MCLLLPHNEQKSTLLKEDMRTYYLHSISFVAFCRLLFLAVLLCSNPLFSSAQITYTETFDVPASMQSLPLGWAQGRQGSGNDIDNMWDRVTSGTSPFCSPYAGTGMLRYHSRIINPGEASYIASKRFDLRTIPAAGAPLSFRMFRDNGYSANGDRITVFVNATPDLTGSPLMLIENSTSANIINRSCSLSPTPASTCSGWNYFNYTIPSTWNSTSVYVVIVATSAFGNSIFIDDFSVTSYPKAANQSLVTSSPAVINQNSLLTAKNTSNQHIIGVRISMDGNYVPRVLSHMEFNTNGTTSPEIDIVNAKLWFTGGTPVFNPANAFLLGTVAQPWLTNYMFLTPPVAGYTGLASINTLEHGDNYFWISYDITPGAITNNLVDAQWIGFRLTGIQYTPGTYTLSGSREIGDVYCTPTYSVGTSWLNYSGNDFINSVQLAGNQSPGINNNQNIINSYAGPLCPFFYPANCPFQTHPSDYELMPQVTGKTTTLTANGVTSYGITLQAGSYGSGNAIAAWIDYNRNSVFEPSEKIAQSGLLGPMGIFSTSFVVPLAAIPGETRMRVREAWLDLNLDPCNHRFFGETEDYIITIIRDCPSPLGWTTWLGYSEEWSDPANWCPATAPVAGIPADVNVIIPGGPTFTGYTYHRPIIKSGVQARALRLKIQNTDTLYIDAPVAGSLTVLDSLIIQNSTSALVVNSIFSDSAQLFNGVLNRPFESPLKSNSRSRSLLLFTQADLLSDNIKANDKITEMRLHMQRKSNGNPYKNLTVKIYYTSSGFNFTSGSAGVLPAVVGPAPVTVFSGDVNPGTYISLNNYGTITIPFTTPFIWNGVGNQLVVEICYDNTGFPSTGINDEIKFTQTTSFRKYMTLENLTAYPKAGCDILPADYFNVTASGVAGANTVIIDPAFASLVYTGARVIGSGPFNGSINALVQSISGNTVTLSAPVAATFTNGTITFYNTNSVASNYRPNITFGFTRPYNKYPIFLSGHWYNNGNFIASDSRVTLNGTSQQHIDGNSITSFYDLKIQNASHVVRLKDFIVTDSLQLISGRLKLNNGLVTLTNQSPSALTFNINSGDIQAETDLISANASPYGRISWDMGTVAGLRVFPFINPAGIRIPLYYTIDYGTHQVTAGTYATTNDNLNWPLPDVTNILGLNNAIGGGWGASGWSMVDRYYLVQNSASGQADLVFRYAVNEEAQSGNSDMRAQRWINGSSLWEFPFQPNQSFTPGNPNSVQINDYTGFNSGNWWTIVGETTPLPVTLLEFTAQKKQDRVKLNWSTASEINNDYFIVDRTRNQTDFKFIARVESAGNGNNIRHYEAWDNNPVPGLQYYHLRQYDLDGSMVSYGPVAINYDTDLFEIITTMLSPGNNGLSVMFSYNSDEPYSYRIMDMTGRLITAKDKNEAVDGLNVINIEADLSKGAYYLLLQNSSKVVTRKFFY